MMGVWQDPKKPQHFFLSPTEFSFLRNVSQQSYLLTHNKLHFWCFQSLKK